MTHPVTFPSFCACLHRWLVSLLKKETRMALGPKSERESEVAHVPGTEIERALQGKNASAIAPVNGNAPAAVPNLQTGNRSSRVVVGY